ncbi:DUF6383 domain-containing protein [Parabacteroides sp.]
MNKKFSTLVASLLFASAFSAYAGTPAQMLSTPTTVEASTRAAVKAVEVDLDALDGWDATATVEGLLLPEFKNDSRLFVIQNSTTTAADADDFLTYDSQFKGDAYASATAAAFYWSLSNGEFKNQEGHTLNVGGYSSFTVVPVKNSGDEAVNGTFFALAIKDADGIKYVEYDGTDFTISTTAGAAYDTNIATAALFTTVETAFSNAAEGQDLNKELKDGFSVAVTYGDKTVVGAELFGSKLTAMTLSGGAFAPATTETPVYLKNKDNKYLVFDASLNGTNAVKGGFKLVSETDAKLLTTTAQFTINTADNGTKAVQVLVDTDKRLYVNVSNGTNVLTALNPDDLGLNAANWAETALGASNTLDFNTLLTGQFIKVNYVKTGNETTANTYKINGILALRDNAGTTESDFVKTADVVAEDPATMWAPSINAAGNLLLTNRENTDITVELAVLREVKAGVYEVSIGTADGIADDDQVTISFVEKTTKTDGYMVEADNVLRNSTYYLGQSRRNADGDVPAYWAENHGTHQIGATVNQDEATKWNLELIKKDVADHKSEIDTVLVVSTLYAYNTKTGVISEYADTLAVLPYVFQNRENREYVKLNNQTNLEYYICDKDNKVTPRSAQFFALKKKPGNTYNYVTLVANTAYSDGNVDAVAAVNGANKVYLKNSESKGAWENIANYADDANSLMVVEKIDDPEYRKVEAAWGDTVRIYREEYPTEVLFEKHDAKSVVDGETLSFLNINNSVTGANPALFVDTAYVNRTVNGVDNTCYQYLLAVNVDKENSYYCPYNPEHNTDEWRKEHNGPCADAKENVALKGRFLINLVDTAFAYKHDHLHNNPYINMVEADENLAKLSFVEGVHVKDTLIITRKGGESVKLRMDDPNFNVAKFAFRYVDNKAGSFKIQTQYKDYSEETQKAFDESASNEGYLRWVNGTVVVTNKYTNGETFNMEENYEGNPTANEAIEGAATFSVTTAEGAVIVKGAEGKKVVISNVLGQTVASAVISSNEAKISTPAGVVVVAVEGEGAVKAIVK